MAKSRKNSVGNNGDASGILNVIGAKMLDTIIVPAQRLLTWDDAHPNFDSPTANVGRDVEHTESAILATAVSLLTNGQFVPLFTCPQGDNEHVLIDGQRRLSAAKRIMEGFDYDGITYPPQPLFTLAVRPVVREDSADLTLEQVQALGRYLNTDRSMKGVSGPLSIGRTAKSLKATNPGKSNRFIIDLMRGSGIEADDSTVSRGLRMASLPMGMQEQILIGENSHDSGIGYSALQPWLGKEVQQPTDAQWSEFYARCTYQKTVNPGMKKQTTVTLHDFRAEVLRAWYMCKFDLTGETSPFKKWKCDGSSLPKLPEEKIALTPEQERLRKEREKYAWSNFLKVTKSKAAGANVPDSVKVTMLTVVDIVDRMTFSASRADTLTANKAANELVNALSALASGDVVIPTVETTTEDAVDAA